MQDDIPFLLAGYGGTDGYRAPPFDQVQYFRRIGKIRSRPLIPPDNPAAVLETVVKSTQSIFSEAVRHPYYDLPRSDIVNQLLWLLDSVYRKEFNFDGWRNASPEEMKELRDKVIREILADLSKLEIRWDSERNCYVRSDGSRLPDGPSTPGAEFWPDQRRL